jgi:anaerobic selenocysteine-containing dehydrogenase
MTESADLSGSVTPQVLPFTCRCCSAGCGMLATVRGDRVIKVAGDRAHPISKGYTCSKGRAIPALHHSDLRISDPRVRGLRASWEPALDDIAGTVRRLIAEGGPDRVGYYTGTGFYSDSLGWWVQPRFFERLGTKQRYSTATVDTAPIYRAAELVTGFWHTFPSWVPEDGAPRLVIFLGVNPAVSHGYIGSAPFTNPTGRLRSFRESGGELWVIDPRKTRSAALADHHLAPRPGTDALILAWLIRELLESGCDREELAIACVPDEVERLRRAVAQFELPRVAAAADVAESELLELLAAIRRHRKLAILPGTGISFQPQGVVAEWLRWALLIITGSLDTEGGMHFNPSGVGPPEKPWTGHAPAEGAYAPAPSSRPDLRGLFGQRAAAALADEVESRELRALFVVGGNPLTALPRPDRVKAALRKLEMLVVIDTFENETTELATHVLPTAWLLERSDIQLLGRTQFSPALFKPLAERKPAWWIYAQLAQRLNIELFDAPIDPDTCTEAEVLRRFAATARGGPETVLGAGTHGIRFPASHGWVHRHVLKDHCWRLAPAVLVDRLPNVWPRGQAPLHLVCGRRMDSSNSTDYGRGLEPSAPLPEIHVSEDAAARIGIEPGERIWVSSASGEVSGVARVDTSLRPGLVWINHGWLGQNVNRLTDGIHIDPLTCQPLMSAIPVGLARHGVGTDTLKNGECDMISIEEQTRIAIDFVTHVAGGGIDEKYYAEDLTVWTSTTGLISRESYLPRLALAKQVWSKPLRMTIDSTTAQQGRVVLQAHSHGVLFNGAVYGNEYLFLMEFNEEGRLRHIREYFNVDRLRALYLPAVAEWKSLHGGASVS